jgi:hypothetical protein
MSAKAPLNVRQAMSLARDIHDLYRREKQPNLVDAASDTQVLIEQLGSRYRIVFPGTASLRDAWTDARVRKVTWFNNCKTHAGFTAAYRTVGAEILARVINAEAVFIAGHSLGGALATLCADALKDAGVPVWSVFTFGSPRVGNGTFAREYNRRLAAVTHRITNAGDPVPWVPLPLPTFTSGIYTHVDHEFRLGQWGGYTVDPSPLLQVGELLGAIRAPAAALASADHPITNYLAKLETLL